MSGLKRLDKDKTGENISRHIQRVNLTFDQLAEHLELTSPRVIYDWIDGLKCPSIERLVMLSELFQVPLEDILAKKDIL